MDSQTKSSLVAETVAAIKGVPTKSDLKLLLEQNVLVISGLAFGIDTIAHKAALKNNLQTSYSLANYNVSKAKTLKALYIKQTESTQQAISLLIAAYSNSETDFEEILRMNQDLLMFQTATITAYKNQFIAQSTIDYLISKQE